MLEIVLIWRLAVYIGIEATKKGLKKPLYQIMAVCLWICGELSGSIVGEIFLGIHGSFWLRYSIAFVGALVGAGISFLIMELIPQQHNNENNIESENKSQNPSIQKFRRSFWLPLITVFSAIFCLFMVISVSLILYSVGIDGMNHVSNPIMGIEIESGGKIKQSISEISSMEKIIYIGFDLRKPHGGETPILLDWYINDELMWSTKRNLNQGHIVMAFIPDEFNLSKFKKGKYEIKIRSEEEILNSLKFEVK